MLYFSLFSILFPLFICEFRVLTGLSTWDIYYTNLNFLATFLLSLVIINLVYYFFKFENSYTLKHLNSYLRWIIFLVLTTNLYTILEVEGTFSIDLHSDLTLYLDFVFVAISLLYLSFGIYVFLSKNNPIFNLLKVNADSSVKKYAAIISGKIMILASLFSMYLPLKAVVGSYPSFLALFLFFTVLSIYLTILFYKYSASEDYSIYNKSDIEEYDFNEDELNDNDLKIS